MKIAVNGEEVILKQAVNVERLLELQKVEMANYVTVQINDEIVDREDFENTLLKEGDSVEFLYFMGGGAA
ncbi:hypothetical protein P22_3137 [Propionispora sp. 2/2-37]|uniref:sulfur carrier protein ThiS n=1 Tax=Propionispora sp. 2/2-37 TaxID=1677858 RepID=UPI0006BB7F17|nr:sulfur carrier protein ThiS [Propionispora sp. 2/2-37]CUH97011.1 hypothetical protein P22_3137 [Propionispora sp. 2/2-37]